MKCPNCQFDLKNPGPNCPFCQYTLEAPEAETDDAAVPAPDGPSLPGDPAVPGQPIPEPGGGAGMEDSSAQESQSPIEIELTPVAPPKSGNNAKLLLIVGGAFLAYKIGLFDNILMAVGLKSRPVVEMAEAEPAVDPAIPTIDSTPVKKTEPPTYEPTTPTPSDQTFDPLNDPRMKELNAEVEKKIAARDDEVAAADERNKLLKKKYAADAEGYDEAVANKEVGEEEDEYLEDWLFKGRIYDMISLKPVAKATLMLMDSTEQNIYTANSDAKGNYEFDVPEVEGGYKLVVDHAYYLAVYFDEIRPPYHKTAMNKRRQLRSARPKHKPWIGGEKTVRRDIILFPEIPDR